MLTFKVTAKDGNEYTPVTVLTAVLDCDLSVPADSLTVTCPYSAPLCRDADYLSAYDGDKQVFHGQIDAAVTEKHSAGTVLKLSARSLAAALLDNEAEPVTYFNPTAGLIERRHLKPFGITLADSSDNIPYYDKLIIDKGMSHWQVVQRFCRSRYHSEPRVSGDGRAFLQGVPELGSAVFSDTGGGIRYFALTERRRRYRLLSEIRLKFEQGSSYRSYIKNNNPEAAALTRVRYVNAAADKTTLATADKMLENSNRESYAMILRCSGCHADLLGMRASVEDSVLGMVDRLTVEKVRYTVNSGGEQSEITLKKGEF